MGPPASEPTYRPSLPAFTQYAWLQGSREWDCASLRALENNVDWCHPAFAHPGIHPQSMFVQEHGFHEYAYEMRVLPQGLVVFAPPTAAEDAPIPEQPWVVIRFELPDRVTLHRPRAEVVTYRCAAVDAVWLRLRVRLRCVDLRRCSTAARLAA